MIESHALLLRDAMLVVVWLTAVYLVFTLLTLFRLSRPRGMREGAWSMADHAALAARAAPASGEAQTSSQQPEVGVTRTLRVSPRHDVAISLAFQGFDVASIARRCDISLAEAKLAAVFAESCRALENPSEEQHGPHARVAA
jgi:hypothetical protein